MLPAQKIFAESSKPKTFVALVSHIQGGAVHLITTYDYENKPCWFLLKATALSLVKLERTAYEDIIDLTQFGEIVACGWGHTPDALALALHK